MATTRAFVHMLVNSVCLPHDSSITPEQWDATTSAACDAVTRSLRSSDGQLNELARGINPEILRGQTIRMAVKRLPTPAFLSSPFEPDRWSFRVIDFLAGVFNFSTEFVPSQPAAGGVPSLSDGSWTGLTGQLVRKEVNMTASFLAATSGRIDAVAFGQTVGHSQIGLLIQRPTAQTRDDSLLAPFTSQVWIVILLSMLLMGPLIWLIIRFRVWLAPGDVHLNRIIPLTSCIWFVYGGLMKQGTTLQPITHSSRMLFATWWIYITVLTAFYTANLTAYLTFSSMKVEIETVADLYASEQAWLAPAGDSIQMFVDGSMTLRAMYEQGRGSFISDYETPAQIVRKVRGGGYVYIDEVTKLKAMMMEDYHKSNQTCSVYVVTLKDQYFKLALAAPKGSPLLDVFDPTLQWLVMTGILPKWSQDAAVDSAPCEASDSIQGTKLRRSELRMVFWVMLVAYGSACGLLALELTLSWLVRRYRRGNTQSKDPPTISGVRHVVLHAKSDSNVHRAWMEPAGHMSSIWASPFADPHLDGRRSKGNTSPSGDTSKPEDQRALTRSDREVIQDMRSNIRRINGRPYMFVRSGEGLQPVPVDEDRAR
ncbi:glutamate receptor ionotropic, delta-2-like isoform X2 [Amphibalanus amphitrite]|uniref:glutamate receptor ionotropic, delta-2-like isoform X2 n=1 Tax=Amphibalanus amphitrite TaxID=1232801 RepID=UPI001C90F850|nr:glutamate receptor ionotropic, delta-2-like isoform X2 [Amphibalanus amphitrite]